MLLLDYQNAKLKALHYSLPLVIVQTYTGAYQVNDKNGEPITDPYKDRGTCEKILTTIAEAYNEQKRVFYLSREQVTKAITEKAKTA